jgi:hypothetical protein
MAGDGNDADSVTIGAMSIVGNLERFVIWSHAAG